MIIGPVTIAAAAAVVIAVVIVTISKMWSRKFSSRIHFVLKGCEGPEIRYVEEL